MRTMDKFKIPINWTVRKAVKQIDEAGIGFGVCVDSSDKVVGVISDGDFRRAILSGLDLNEDVSKLMNDNFLFVKKNYQETEVRRIFSNSVVQHIPVLNDGKIVEIITEEAFFGIEKKSPNKELKTSVVIMAGGKGTRLDPFTRILPKPLIPLGNDPVIKVIMDEFLEFGCSKFYITLNDKAKMIRAYFGDHELNFDIKFVEEAVPLGTAGAIKLLEKDLVDAFFVSNCDIIIKCDYSEIVKFHRRNQNNLTIVGSMQQYTIPYGICDIDTGGELKQIREKPQYDFLVNTGFYLVEPDMLKYIPEDIHFDMTDLIDCIKEKGHKIGVFPVSQESWIDIGQWSEYQKSVKRLGLIE